MSAVEVVDAVLVVTDSGEETQGEHLIARILVWGCTLGFAGAVIADYTTYDETYSSMATGAAIGIVAGIVVAVAIVRHRSR